MKSDNKATSFLFDLKELFVFISVYIVFIGWMYKYYFVHGFGISTHEVELSSSDYMMYAYTVFAAHWFIMTILLLLIFGVTYKNLVPNLYIKVIIIITCFPVFWWVASDVALKSVKAIRVNPEKYLNQVSFIYNKGFTNLNDSTNTYSQDIPKSRVFDLNKYGKFYSLFTNSNGYYVFTKNDLPDVTPADVIYYLKKENVEIIVFTQKILK